jgi:phytoene synthase
MTRDSDIAHCAEAIRHGSRSFHAASRLLPARVRDPALALYAFCRLADDAVDLADGKERAVARLRDRLERCYDGRPRNAPEDRAFAALVQTFEMPRALPEALLEGLAWDAGARRYDDLAGLRAYSARVASSVGAMMCVLMRVRDRSALARACDLGVAMQLTNIARDVGEDAREGRLYLPLDWMRDAGLDPDRFLAAPAMSPALGALVRRLLTEADALYRRSEAGVAALPLSCRPGIFAARFIYAGIGREVERAGCNSVDRRAHTSGAQKVGWLARSALRAAGSTVLPASWVRHARPLDETAFLVAAAARAPLPGRTDRVIDALAALKAHDVRHRADLASGRADARSPA